MNKTFLLLRLLPLIAACALSAPVAAAEPHPAPEMKTSTTTNTAMRIRITINNTVLKGELQANAAAQEFMAMLPLKLELSDYNNTEKIAQLPEKLSTANSPEGFTPAAGDIAFYAPWGNLAIFYKEFRYSKGLIRLGQIQGDIDVLKKPMPLQALIERE